MWRPKWTTALTRMYEPLWFPRHYITMWCVYAQIVCCLKLLKDVSNTNGLASLAHDYSNASGLANYFSNANHLDILANDFSIFQLIPMILSVVFSCQLFCCFTLMYGSFNIWVYFTHDYIMKKSGVKSIHTHWKNMQTFIYIIKIKFSWIYILFV